MKKKIVSVLIVVISLFLFCGRVEAAKELTCICEDTNITGGTHYMIVQNSNGELFYFRNSYGNATIDDTEWWDPLANGHLTDDDYKDTNKYQNGVLSSCPNYSQGYEMVYDRDKKEYTEIYYFSDKKYWNKDDHTCVQYDELPDLNVAASFDRDKINEYNAVIENTEWSAKCTYYDENSSLIYLYFNEDKYILINESSLIKKSIANFSLKELWEVANAIEGCPPYLYQTNALPTASLYKDFWFNYSFASNGGSGEVKYTSINPEVNFIPSVTNPIEPPIDDCQALFGDELVEKINDIMDIVKIVVPILLIVFGIIDFTKAIFSGNTDDMSKTQKKFLKRIVAAVLVFLAPIFINLILDLANVVWDDINPDNCIKQNQ